MLEIKKDGKFTFAVLSEEVFAELRSIEPERMFVSEENVNKIKNILKLNDLSNEELQAVRNTIVKDLCEDKESYDKVHMDNWTRMSMITAVIDGEKYKKGMVV